MTRQNFLIRLGIVLLVLIVTLILVVWKVKFDKTPPAQNNDVTVPTIVGGNLVLPRVDLQLNQQSSTGAAAILDDQIWVQSANLVGIFSQSQAPQMPIGSQSAQPAPQQQLTGLRILGEMYNPGGRQIRNFLPVVRFLDNNNNLQAQKLAHFSQNYDFYGLDPKSKGVYDITVDNPPMSDKVEVVLTSQEADQSLRAPVALKVASRSAEIQPVTVQDGSTVDTYLVTGEVINTTNMSVADILVNAYVKDTDNKVFGFAKQAFKSDLIRPGDTIPFKILVLPVKTDATYAETNVEVWGREYKL